VGREIDRQPADVVFGTFGDLLAHTPTTLPMVVWTDGTFRRMLDFYPDYQNLCAESRRDGLAMDEALLRRCRLVIFSSEWAAQSGRDDYGLDPARVRVVPFGANIECERTRTDIEALIARRQGGPCRLLFIGRIWQRKGGEIALEAARKLNESGLPTELTLLGSGPEDTAGLPPWVHALGFVSKSDPAGRRRLDELLAESHFLIVPSRAEAYGIVFCEAASFGLPSVATNVGGIPTIIRDGVTGRTFPLEANGEAYAGFIREMMQNQGAYQTMARAAFAEYETRLNWNVAGKRVMELLRQLK
jgi:glycosyltransferase involved in cell wall biosynthesis